MSLPSTSDTQGDLLPPIRPGYHDREPQMVPCDTDGCCGEDGHDGDCHLHSEATVATDDDSLVARVGMILHDEGFAVSVDTVKQIVKTIRDNRAALDFLGRM